MITYIKQENAQQYKSLFDKATKLIKDHPEHFQGKEIDWNKFLIGSLNGYFAYLQDILAIAGGPSSDSARFFVRLPLDEEVLAIKADTREIAIPSSFVRHGIGVQGDAVAEVIYFTIDRFFDSVDLANDDIKIAIQWEAKDANKQVIRGFSRNFGKDIESIPGKIIFGWPISSELTQTGGIIKFAVRFYTIDEINKIFTYSFATLPAELTINNSLDYDLINNETNLEVDHGNMIINRIKNSGIYDPSFTVPDPPIITKALYAKEFGENGQIINGKIIDLPASGDGVYLIVEASPTAAELIDYTWQVYTYNTETGDYTGGKGSLQSPDSVSVAYIQEDQDIPVDTLSCYFIKREDNSYDSIPSSLADYLVDPVEGYYKCNAESKKFTLRENGTAITLYRRMSVANVHNVGIYIVDATAKNEINSNTRNMNIEDGIKIPGPEKPIVSFPANDNVSNDEDHIIVAHAVDAAPELKVAKLKVVAETGESQINDASLVGANPQVTLKYKWTKNENNVAVSLPNTDNITVSIAANNTSGASTVNQSYVKVYQNGANVLIYPDSTIELETIEHDNNESTWIALDIDTGNPTLAGSVFDGVELVADDAKGHFIFWIDSASTSPITKVLNDTTLTFTIVSENPILDTSTIQYSFSTDRSEISIYGLNAVQNLNNYYNAEVTATRNGESTAEILSGYRVTHEPEVPEIKVYDFNVNTNRTELVSRDYTSQKNVYSIYRATSSSLGFSVTPLTRSDGLSYIWMKMNIDSNEPEDWENSVAKLQIDIDDAINGLSSIFSHPGDPDIPLEADPNAVTYGEKISSARKYIQNLTALGELVDNEHNMPSYTLTSEDTPGYYYCLVINEFNGNLRANASPFFDVRDN